ncbi:MAG: hypothetical protein PHC34_03020 [Candidatus Gastranaerophilales bacterium]|nr:hypothetical protein [Candidatus Gastranaerophilales bacterium]
MNINQGIKQNNINFSGIYSLKGTPREIAQAYDIIVEKNAKDKRVTDFLDLQSDNDCRIVLTGRDTDLKNQFHVLLTKAKNGLIVFANDLLDSTRLKTFLPTNGICYKRINVPAEGMEFRCLNNNKSTIKIIYSIIFDKDIAVAEGLQELINLKKNVNKEEFHLYVQMPGTLYEFKKAVESSEKLRNLRMKAYKDSGAFNTVIELTNDQILKLSESPNFPKKAESFELPILDSGIIEVENSWGSLINVYYYIQPKALNSDETNITREMVESMTKKMKAEGFEPQDMRAEQLGIYNGETYLLDTGCIKDRWLIS